MDEHAVETWTVRELKTYLEKLGICYADCPEKADLVERVRQCQIAERSRQEQLVAIAVRQSQPAAVPSDVEELLKHAFTKEQLDFIVARIRNQIIPGLIEQISAFQVPPLNETSPDADYGATGVAMEKLQVAPENIDVDVQSNAIRLRITSFSARLREFDWHYARKNKFPRIKDSGRAKAKIEGGSIDILLNITLMPFALDVAHSEVQMDKLVIKTSGTKASFVYNMLLSVFSSALKKQLCLQLASLLQQTIQQLASGLLRR
eukprot:TRINITY_DN15945_c0_g1_i1.p1 TRINITY_DN15945_c0_g1~~TRINITY_DN15945_c0_g1_i1.p1  ORF type:complete len:262 (+),score=80.29 TRINITY_DN15945_c0_g1_i1:218-1003(+)